MHKHNIAKAAILNNLLAFGNICILLPNGHDR